MDRSGVVSFFKTWKPLYLLGRIIMDINLAQNIWLPPPCLGRIHAISSRILSVWWTALWGDIAVMVYWSSEVRVQCYPLTGRLQQNPSSYWVFPAMSVNNSCQWLCSKHTVHNPAPRPCIIHTATSSLGNMLISQIVNKRYIVLLLRYTSKEKTFMALVSPVQIIYSCCICTAAAPLSARFLIPLHYLFFYGWKAKFSSWAVA